jgi:hypothetical protein
MGFILFIFSCQWLILPDIYNVYEPMVVGLPRNITVSSRYCCHRKCLDVPANVKDLPCNQVLSQFESTSTLETLPNRHCNGGYECLRSVCQKCRVCEHGMCEERPCQCECVSARTSSLCQIQCAVCYKVHMDVQVGGGDRSKLLQWTEDFSTHVDEMNAYLSKWTIGEVYVVFREHDRVVQSIHFYPYRIAFGLAIGALPFFYYLGRLVHEQYRIPYIIHIVLLVTPSMLFLEAYRATGVSAFIQLTWTFSFFVFVLLFLWSAY